MGVKHGHARCFRTLFDYRCPLMKRVPLITSFLCLVLCLLPPSIEGQIGFFKRSGTDAIIRKAKRYNLVAVKDAVPGAFVDLRYTITSASGEPLYLPEMPCLVHRSTAEKLAKVNKALREEGYALVIWDAWRPPEAHIALWNAVKDPKFVVPPNKGLSWHCYGISVDLTLATLDGKPLPMPSDFDEFSPRASSNYSGSDPDIKRRVDLIQKLMREAGFRTIQSEWWHFDDMNARGGIRNVTAKDLGIPMP